MEPRKRNILTITLFIIYMLLLTAIILFKLPFYSSSFIDVRVINLIPFQDVFRAGELNLPRDLIDNILIFIPFGIYLCMLKSEWPLRNKVVSIIGLSLFYEVSQFIFALGRTDITDVIANTIGGIIGIGIYAVLFKFFKTRTNKIVNVVALIVTVCVVIRFAQLFYLSYFVMGHLAPA